jgi:hypothetical protein
MRLLASLLLLATTATWAADPALHDGEKLTYKVGWGIFPHAGEIKISAQNEPITDAPTKLRVTTTTATTGLAHSLYTFEARAEAVIDPKTGRLLTNMETSKAPNRETKNSVIFDYIKSTASYVNAINTAKDATLNVPPGDPLDLIMSLVQTRTWDLKPGEKRDALVLFDDDFYELTIYADRYEEVRTPLGKFQTLVLVPRMEKTPPKGMFKKGSAVSVWISQDERRLPVKFQVDFKFGAGVATLTKYQPPTVIEAKTDRPASAATDTKPAVAGPESDAKNPRS